MTRASVELKRFGRRIRTLRSAKGWSQERLAEKAELHRTYIGGIERGLRNPSLRNILKLAEALEVPPATLFEAPSTRASDS